MIVTKVGGSEGVDLDAVCTDVAQLISDGRRLLLVHGGSHLTNELAEALGHPPKFITSPSGFTSRLTDRRTLEIFKMAYCGQINKAIVERLQALGVNAVGLSGIDGAIWKGPRKKAVQAVENGRKRIIRDNLTGKVDCVNVSLLNGLLDRGYLPVLTPPALSYDGEAINVDGDRAAAATAIALGAETLVLLSNVPGVLRDFPDETSLIKKIDRNDIEETRRECARGRMRIKLLGAEEALAGGVGKVILGDSRGDRPVFRALTGHGTLIQ